MLEEVFIVGCGDIGRRVAGLWRQRGVRVTALARSERSAQALRAAGIATRPGDLDDAASLAGLDVHGMLLYYFAPPSPDGERDERLRNFVAAVKGAPRRAVYISTTGVYGDAAGAWVDEDTPPAPGTGRGRRRLDAEQTIADWAARLGADAVILRVPGIYGPGRLPLERIRRAEPVLDPAECGYTNRIHAEDLAEVCVAAAEHGRPGAVYNVSDGAPGTMTEYLFAVADAAGLPRPPVVGIDEARRVMSAGMLSYLGESRRIANDRMLAELGVRLRYPDLASGLAACFAASAPRARNA
jgi:nucleoside-diphosphate-sugar epimerase